MALVGALDAQADAVDAMLGQHGEAGGVLVALGELLVVDDEHSGRGEPTRGSLRSQSKASTFETDEMMNETFELINSILNEIYFPRG
jgi:hypothetical protein